MDHRPRRILEIGIGAGIVSQTLRTCGMSVTTLDHSKDLHPDVVASVTDMPLDNGSFDLVLCCEVLEHIPYRDFEKALFEIRRVANKYFIMTLPDQDRFYRAEVMLPFMKRARRLCVERPLVFPPRHIPDGEHFWEIGKKGYPLVRVCGSIESAGFSIDKTYRIWEIPWHRMFVAHKTVSEMG